MASFKKPNALQSFMSKVGSESFNALDRDLEMKKMAALMTGDTFTILNLFHKEVVALRKQVREAEAAAAGERQEAEGALEAAAEAREALEEAQQAAADAQEKLHEALMMNEHSQAFIQRQKEEIDELKERFATIYDEKQDIEAQLLPRPMVYTYECQSPLDSYELLMNKVNQNK
jgi:hypothetical protein